MRSRNGSSDKSCFIDLELQSWAMNVGFQWSGDRLGLDSAVPLQMTFRWSWIGWDPVVTEVIRPTTFGLTGCLRRWWSFRGL